MMRMILSGKKSIDDYRVKPEEEEISITMHLQPLSEEQHQALRVQRELQDQEREARGLPPEVYVDITLNL
jgi:hypothetical protein